MKFEAMETRAQKKSKEVESEPPILVDLPAHLLDPIADKLPAIEDLVRFGAVCRPLRGFALKKEKERSLNLSHPWMMFTDDAGRFYSLTRGELFELELVSHDGIGLASKRAWGSPFGWLAVFGFNLDVFLFNPLSGAFILLPRLLALLTAQYNSPNRLRVTEHTFRCLHFSVSKLLLTAPPPSPNCVVFAIFFHTQKLGFLNLDAKSRRWYPLDGCDLWSEIVCFRGRFFGCLKDGRVLTLDMSSKPPKAVEFAPPPPEQELAGDADSDCRKYLVELQGELCMVVRCGNVLDRLKLEFRVFRINMSTKQLTRVMSLGGHCLFLGTNYSYAVQASDQLKPDCIYFTNDDYNFYSKIRECGTGTYDVIKGEVTAFTPPPPSVAVADQTINLYFPPIWFTPSLH